MEHRFVKISYTGRMREGAVFDTTDKETAAKEKIFDEEKVYKPMPVVVGEGQVLKGLDEALKDMKAGDEKDLEIPPEKAYGQRDPNLIRLVPMKAFKEQKMTPIPGMVIELDGRPARIQTVAGGRVRVDFNSELAGKTLLYKLKVDEEAKTDGEKIRCLIERSFNTQEGFESKRSGKSLEVTIPETAYKDRNLLIRKASFVSETFKYMDLETVTYAETWKKKKKEDKKRAGSAPTEEVQDSKDAEEMK